MELKHYKSLPKKRMSAGAIIFNDNEKILIVKPTYKEHWHIPGGIIEEDESPLYACQRELDEELGLKIEIKSLLTIDYKPATQQYTESLNFIFYGGKIGRYKIKNIVIPQKELETYKFISKDQVSDYLSISMAKRIQFALKAIKENKTYYLEQQKMKFR